MRAKALEARQSGFKWSESSRSVISRDHTEVILERAHTIDQRVHELLIDVKMEVREVKHRKAVEHSWEARERYLVGAQLDRQRVAPPALMQADEPQAPPDKAMNRVSVLDVGKVSAPTEDVCLVVLLQP